MSTRADTTFSFSEGIIRTGTTRQSHRFWFPHRVTNNGVTRHRFSASHWRDCAQFGLGFGTVTPWGDVTINWRTSTHTHNFFGNGCWATFTRVH